MTARKQPRSRASAHGRTTPKGVRPAGFTDRSASDAAGRKGARPVDEKSSRQLRARSVAVRPVHLHLGHRGGR